MIQRRSLDSLAESMEMILLEANYSKQYYKSYTTELDKIISIAEKIKLEVKTKQDEIERQAALERATILEDLMP